MNKYKVEFRQTETYVIDVLAENEADATEKATAKFYDLEERGTLHYKETGDGGLQVGTVYDVTNTDDPFDA